MQGDSSVYGISIALMWLVWSLEVVKNSVDIVVDVMVMLVILSCR